VTEEQNTMGSTPPTLDQSAQSEDKEQPKVRSSTEIEWIDFRDLTVGRSLRTGGSDQVSFLRVEGQWFRKAGFPVGSKVQVAVAERRLLIEPKGSPMDLCFGPLLKSVAPELTLPQVVGIAEPMANPADGLDAVIPNVVPDRFLRPAAQLNGDSEWLDFRKLTVGRSTGRDQQAPFLRLEGRWLWKAGFLVGSKVLVAVAERRLLIEPESPLIELRLDPSPKPLVPKKRLAPSVAIVEYAPKATERLDATAPTFVHDRSLHKKASPK
jgi:hypothetical protein